MTGNWDESVECIPGRNHRKIASFPLCNVEIICLVIYPVKNIQLARNLKLYATNVCGADPSLTQFDLMIIMGILSTKYYPFEYDDGYIMHLF